MNSLMIRGGSINKAILRTIFREFVCPKLKLHINHSAIKYVPIKFLDHILPIIYIV